MRLLLWALVIALLLWSHVLQFMIMALGMAILQIGAFLL
jgi:hypothetical protein